MVEENIMVVVIRVWFVLRCSAGMSSSETLSLSLTTKHGDVSYVSRINKTVNELTESLLSLVNDTDAG